MISFINGAIVEKNEGKIVVECKDIGYEIFVSNNTLVSIGEIGDFCKVLTYMQVREDGITLFGFSTQEEKDLFMLLTTVSGIGAKMAITILSGMKISEIIIAIASGDTVSLSRIKGLGKKTAERLVLELQDKVSPVGVNLDSIPLNENQDAVDEAVEVLIALGINKNEALKLARTHSANTSEQIVQNVLKNLGR